MDDASGGDGWCLISFWGWGSTESLRAAETLMREKAMPLVDNGWAWQDGYFAQSKKWLSCASIIIFGGG